MATNPKMPPEQPERPLRVVDKREIESTPERHFPWGLFGAIVLLICIAFIAWFIFH